MKQGMAKMRNNLRRIRFWEIALTAAVMALPLIPGNPGSKSYSFVHAAHAVVCAR